MTIAAQYTGIIESEEQLRDILGLPSENVIRKVQRSLDRFTRYFVERSPFVLMSTSGRDGRCDASPKGDAPGFVKVLDDRKVLIPDRPGNKRADTFLNILDNPQVGTLFLIPEVEETLRINGRAIITTDPQLLAQCTVTGKTPRLGIIVETEEIYFHCAKAFKRSSLWNPDAWEGRGELPSLGEIMAEQLKVIDSTGEQLNQGIEEGYRTNLY